MSLLDQEEKKKMERETLEIVLPIPLKYGDRSMSYLSDTKEYEHFRIIYNLLSLGLIEDDYDIRTEIMKKNHEKVFLMLAKKYAIIRIPRVNEKIVDIPVIYFSSNLTENQKNRIAMWSTYFKEQNISWCVSYENLNQNKTEEIMTEDDIIDLYKKHQILISKDNQTLQRKKA